MGISALLWCLANASAARVFSPEVNYWSLGGAAWSSLTGPNNSAAISVGITRDRQNIQGLLGISSLTAGDLGLSVAYRYTLTGTIGSGLHVGGALGLGSTVGSGFFFGVAGLAGLHFVLPQLDQILFSLDGGLTLGTAGGAATFSLGGVSPALGLSISYLFGGKP